MVTAEQLVDKFFEKAQIHKPSMTPHQLHAYVIGLLADELAWAFNNDDTVARNVKQLLHRLDPRKPSKHRVPSLKVEVAIDIQHSKGQQTNNITHNDPITKSTSTALKIGSDISKTLSFEALILFLNKFPKAVIKELRDQKMASSGYLFPLKPTMKIHIFFNG